MPFIDEERKIESFQIRKRMAEIQGTIYSGRQALGPIQAVVTGPGKGPDRRPSSGWKPFRIHERWGGYDQTTWFRMEVTIPDHMKGRRVLALVRPGGESLAYLNGKPFQGLDENRDELYLTEKAKPGQMFEIVLESVPSTRDDIHHTFQYADIAVMHPEPWDFYWDCSTVIDVWEQLPMNSAPRLRLMMLLTEAVYAVDLQHKGEPAYFESLGKARRILRAGLKDFPAEPGMGRLSVIGHSHLDTAWLWPIRETRRKCARTWSTVLNLLERYPDFRFLASQPAQYAFLKQDYPDVYRRVKSQVKAGRWEPIGAMWIEPDCNVTSGESFIRQLLHGNRFHEQEFGFRSRTAWLPDTFGDTWALPQILRKAGVDTFVTMKIKWGNEFTKFPYSMFQWEGVDGTRILCLMPPESYNGSMTVKQARAQWENFLQKERVEELPYVVGHGDGGGGPTMEMIERARRLADIVGAPKCSFGPLQDSLDRMKQQCVLDDLPVYNDELFLECHRGCQTEQARTKRNNRLCEIMLHNAELVSSLALLNGARYDQKGLDKVWKTVLTNQFHDILPGSSITEVFTQADADYAEVQQDLRAIQTKALQALAKGMDTSGDGTAVLVVNSLSWSRTDVVCLDDGIPKGKVAVLDPAGDPVPHQRIRAGLLFEAQMPPLGCAIYRIVPARGRSQATPSGSLKTSANGMENDFIRIRFDRAGRLSSIYDKVEGREVLPKGAKGNVLQLFDDRPAYSDAWDVDHNLDDIRWEPFPAETIEVVEEGPVRAVVRIVRKTERSTITQDVTLHAHSPRLDFVTQVDWWEKRTFLKAAFPVDVRASKATYEIQFATIERPTHRNTAFDRGRFEVTAHKWADLSEGDYGVSLLNDCKYGHDIKDNVMRVSLLRSTINPDPVADEGRHEFTYSIYPHAWTWRNGTVQQGYELNCRLMALPVPSSSGRRPSIEAFASVDAENVVIETVKRHEDSDALIVRLYEAYGQRGNVALTFGRPPKRISECDLMEENGQPVSLKKNSIHFYITPYEIRTFRVEF